MFGTQVLRNPNVMACVDPNGRVERWLEGDMKYAGRSCQTRATRQTADNRRDTRQCLMRRYSVQVQNQMCRRSMRSPCSRARGQQHHSPTTVSDRSSVASQRCYLPPARSTSEARPLKPLYHDASEGTAESSQSSPSGRLVWLALRPKSMPGGRTDDASPTLVVATDPATLALISLFSFVVLSIPPSSAGHVEGSDKA